MKLQNCIEKMMIYAEPRGIFVKQASLGMYKIIKNKKASVHEAVEAIAKDGTRGWIINMGNDDRQRKFYPAAEVEVVPYTGRLDKLKKLTGKLTKPFRRNKKICLADTE